MISQALPAGIESARATCEISTDWWRHIFAARPQSIMTSYQSVIKIEAGKRGGRPCIRGLRIAVADVLGWLAAGVSPEDILADHPDLVADDIRACLEYAADPE